MYRGGKAEINLKKSVSTTSITILFQLLSSSTLSQVVLGAILQMLFVFPLWMFCCFVDSARLSRVPQMCSARRETNPDDFLIFEVFYGAFWGASEGQGLGQPVERRHFFGDVLDKHSRGQQVH